MSSVLIIAVFALLTLAGIVVMRILTSDRERRGLPATLVKLYGLLSVGGLAVILASMNTDAQVKTGGFTLLGTIAGFLAGANVPDESDRPRKKKSSSDSDAGNPEAPEPS